MVKFVGVFFVAMALGSLALANTFVVDNFVTPWTEANAWASAKVATCLGIVSYAEGVTIRSGPAVLEVLPGCNGLQALLILLGAIAAFPAPWPKRLLGMLLATFVLPALNLVRIINLVVVARYMPDYLEAFHVYVWQSLIVLIALTCFMLWHLIFVGAPRRQGTAGSA